jgi:predicted O-methyltransferase YrrM
LAAVLDNETSSLPPSDFPSLVIGTELEARKAAHAIGHVKEAFENKVPTVLQLLEGDLLKTLPAANIPDASIDALLLDIWAPLAYPTLKLLLPKLRRNAVVFVDNSTSGATRYLELWSFLRDPVNGFLTTTLPHKNGFELAVYVGK